MENKLDITGKSEMKGRNGYSTLGKATYARLPEVRADLPELHYLDFYSKRGSDEPPARLVLTLEDLAAFKAWVAQLEVTHA